MSPIPITTTNRLILLEQALESTNKRMEKYDLILTGMQRSQDKYDLLLQNFCDEMKALHTADVNLSTLIVVHDTTLKKEESRWHMMMIIARWAGGLVVSIGLVFLGVYISHLFR